MREKANSAPMSAIIAPMKKQPKKSARSNSNSARAGGDELERKIDKLTAVVNAVLRQSESDRNRLDRLEKKWEQEREESARRAEKKARKSEANPDRLDRLAVEWYRECGYSERDAKEAARRDAAESREAQERLKKEMEDEYLQRNRHRRRMTRALGDIFARALPRVMRRAHGIVIRPKDIRMRARNRKHKHSREYDFIAPNGKLTLACEVKARLTRGDVQNLRDALRHQFRYMFPEYDGRPVYGVVAGVEIDDEAATCARMHGFYILRIEGANLHPDADPDPDLGEEFHPQPY